MGFDTVSTMSYENHTDVEDNLAIMTTDATDTVSFALATKKIHNDNGAEKL